MLYQKLQGDGAIHARITSIDGSNGFSNGGIMMREGLELTSDFVSIGRTKGRGVIVQWRESGIFDYQIVNSSHEYVNIDGVGNNFKLHSLCFRGNWTQVGPTSGLINLSISQFCQSVFH